MTTDKPKSLTEQLKEEQAKRKGGDVPNQPLTPQQRIEAAKKELEALTAEKELDSARMGYTDFKSREANIDSREKALTTALVKLAADQQTLADDRKSLLDQWEKSKKEYTDAMSRIEIREHESERIMSEAISSKAEAESVINSRTAVEKERARKLEAYSANLGEAFQLSLDMVSLLRRESDPTLLQLAIDLKRDLELMDSLNEKGADLQTLADIYSVDIDRIFTVCEYIQNSKKDFGGVLKFLLDSAQWLQDALLIQWVPNDKEGALH